MTYPLPDTQGIIDDDDWLEPPTQGGAKDPLVDKEYTRISTVYSDAGYREGITDGKLATLQEGFDQAFAQAVPLSRRVGSLRGRAAALLAFATSLSPPAPENLVEDLRVLIRDLSSVRRDAVLPEDEERKQHEEEEHGEGQEAFELDVNDQRDMEGLEKSLEMMGGGGGVGKDEKVGEEGVERLEARLRELEGRFRG
ncbi:hypothetical protein L202_02519 [Cryptococcus amylolentus CBS 6039]|uniref:Protein YAE1 n=2 Tax=Cryptococcus amylolentus TaxID=104669 RepID=A0A1E3I0V8_9TREE|nr:hypothetical protein L202_02519 [Cryptococcus amylolentus CBS 6039]ODN82234.1 hypothetical protein L202_02519 [Cryptococcus amylolentus CBS 6039]ODO09685.1 hypothetical protein I350_01899 [Cryptococcus amylolentus CBS 6273]